MHRITQAGFNSTCSSFHTHFFLLIIEGVEIKTMLWGLWWGSALSHGAEPFCDLPHLQPARHRPSLPGVHPPLSSDHGSLEFIRFLPEQPVGEATNQSPESIPEDF